MISRRQAQYTIHNTQKNNNIHKQIKNTYTRTYNTQYFSINIYFSLRTCLLLYFFWTKLVYLNYMYIVECTCFSILNTRTYYRIDIPSNQKQYLYVGKCRMTQSFIDICPLLCIIQTPSQITVCYFWWSAQLKVDEFLNPLWLLLFHVVDWMLAADCVTQIKLCSLSQWISTLKHRWLRTAETKWTACL